MTREARRFAADRLTEVLARTTGTAQHPSGLVAVTATATGELRSVRLLPAALGHGPDAVGRMVVETARLATDAAVQTGYNEVAKALGDSMAMAVESFAGPPPLHRAAPPEATAPAPPPRTGWPPAARRARPAARPRPPVEVDDDEYFADPFRGQRRH